MCPHFQSQERRWSPAVPESQEEAQDQPLSQDDDHQDQPDSQEDSQDLPESQINLENVSLPNKTRKRGRPKGSNKTVIGLPQKNLVKS